MSLRARFALLALLVSSFAAAQTAPPAAPTEAVVARPESLVSEGVPAIPASLAEEVGRYTEFRSAGFTGWHPTRREMLISTRFGNVAQAHLVKLPGGARTQMTFYPDRVSGARFDPKTGESFIFSKDTGGNEFFQFFRYDFADGSVTLLTDGRSRNTGARWSNGGDRIAYGSTRRTGNDVDIYVVAVKDPKTDRRVLELTGGGWEVADWSPDDSKLLVAEGISINETLPVARRRRDRDEDPADPEGQGEGGVPERGLLPRRQGALRHRRRRLGVPEARLHGPRLEEDRLPDGRHVGRRGLRPVARRKPAGLRHERKGCFRPPDPRHREPPGAARAEASARHDREPEVASGRRRDRLHDGDGALQLRRLFLGPQDRAGRALDVQRAGGPQPADLRRAGARVLEELRRPRNHRDFSTVRTRRSSRASAR